MGIIVLILMVISLIQWTEWICLLIEPLKKGISGYSLISQNCFFSVKKHMPGLISVFFFFPNNPYLEKDYLHQEKMANHGKTYDGQTLTYFCIMNWTRKIYDLKFHSDPVIFLSCQRSPFEKFPMLRLPLQFNLS